jgi:hypothetical protein
MKDIPAFPRPHSGSTQYAQEGMSLRDYFAAKAMQSMIINLNLRPNTHSIGIVGMDIGASSYWIADVMMKAREKT